MISAFTRGRMACACEIDSVCVPTSRQSVSLHFRILTVLPFADPSSNASRIESSPGPNFWMIVPFDLSGLGLVTTVPMIVMTISLNWSS